MRKIRSGDTVLVTSGRNKGQQGKVRVNMIDEIESSSRASISSRSTLSGDELDKPASSRWRPHCTSPTSCSFARTVSSRLASGVRKGDRWQKLATARNASTRFRGRKPPSDTEDESMRSVA